MEEISYYNEIYDGSIIQSVDKITIKAGFGGNIDRVERLIEQNAKTCKAKRCRKPSEYYCGKRGWNKNALYNNFLFLKPVQVQKSQWD